MTRNGPLSLLFVLGLALAAGAQDAPDPAEPAEVTEIRKSVPRLTKKLEELRGATFQREVLVRYQSNDDFRANMMAKLDAEYPAERALKDEKALKALGLLPADYDIRAGMIDAMAAQALAYYDPEQGTFFVVQANLPPSEIDATVLHELHHALQDQRFDLKAMMKPFESPDAANDDAQLALRMMIEGEAFYLQMRFQLESMGGAAMMDQALGLYGNTPRRDLERMERMQLGMLEGGARETAMAALDNRAKLPAYLYHTLVSPYFKGGAAIHALMKRGGFERIDGLFKTLPASTEQLLHPEKCGPQAENRDDPTVIELPELGAALGEGWSFLAKNTFGELHLRALFETLVGRDQAAAAAGWDGDRYHAYGKDGQDWAAFAWYLVFDSDNDAKEFATALEAAKAKGPPPLAGAEITTRAAHVLVLGGVPADKLEAVRTAVFEGRTAQ